MPRTGGETLGREMRIIAAMSRTGGPENVGRTERSAVPASSAF